MKMISALQGMTWPAFPGPAAAQKLALLYQLEQNQWRPAEQIAADQLAQARQVLAFAAATVPHYRQTLGAGFVADEINAAAWRELPILSRKRLHEMGAELHSTRVPAAHGKCHETSTSGSTGLMVKIRGTVLTQLFWEVFCLRDHFWHGRDFAQKLFSVRFQSKPELQGPDGAYSSGWGVATDDVMQTGPGFLFDVRLDLSWLLERLVAERPGYLLAPPSIVLGLALYCRERDIRLPGLIEVRTLGESRTENLPEICREAWDVPLVDMYSCQEAGYLALQCPDHPHYHVQSENVLLEVVDVDGRPCRPGEVGRVLITSLNNFAMPLIRYELGDYAEVGEPCPCGRGLPTLKRVMGRYRNVVRLPDGTRRWALMGFEPGMGLREIAPVEMMQMVQTAREDIEVRLVMSRHLSAGERQALTTFIHGNLGYPFRLNFKYVESIRNPANGKIEYFISLIE
jgi:phenylacetate-CoA ligase